MKRVIRDLIDTLLAIVVVCAFITPILIGISYDIEAKRTKNASRPLTEMRVCTTIIPTPIEDIERIDSLSTYTMNR